MTYEAPTNRPIRIAIVALQNPNIFPALYHIAVALAAGGADVCFISREKPSDAGVFSKKVTWKKLPQAKGIAAKIPWIRTSNNKILIDLAKHNPDFIISQHEYTIAALAYKILFKRKTKIASHFLDYENNRKYMKAIKALAGLIDAHVEACSIRLDWRKRDWPRLQATTFVVRQAPWARRNISLEPHQGPIRVAFTNSKYVLGLNRERISRFLSRLCDNGIVVDWYLPGAEEVRSIARSLVSHPRFAVCDPVEKSRLMDTLGKYDVGLHWAPLAEQAYDQDYFLSAASNKIGEYLAAGLVVAHAGNPGLSYLPEEVCAVFDPTDPVAGADQLAAALADRATVERKRQAALRYHLDEMNFEAQTAPFVRHVMGYADAKPT